MTTSSKRLPGVLAKQTLAVRATDALRELLMGGSLAPGERLNEIELASALGISRAPLREAIVRLANEGLVTTVNHRGSFVRSFTRDNIRELYELRIALETFAVRKICARGNPADIENLSHLLQETDDYLSGNFAAGYPRHADFHELIIKLSGNNQLVETATALHRQIALFRGISGRSPQRVGPAYAEHADVLEAIRRRDPDRAAAALTEHLEASLQFAVALVIDDREGAAPA